MFGLYVGFIKIKLVHACFKCMFYMHLKHACIILPILCYIFTVVSVFKVNRHYFCLWTHTSWHCLPAQLLHAASAVCVAQGLFPYSDVLIMFYVDIIVVNV